MTAQRWQHQLFLGSGERSQADIDRLCQLVEDTVVALSGLQQPTASTDPPEDKGQRAQQQLDYDNKVADIVMALTGKRLQVWHDTDPRQHIDKRAHIVVLYSSSTGFYKHSMTGSVETKNGWCVMFEPNETGRDWISADDDWPAGWLWT